ncbi:hypothetical protein [Micromonospora sp. RTP1Z1]|uniref:hypothetical protein n=1 Tax=Micromonospora sp. RTP1Z1 TaxID=2994043 RepID=UPI0029C95AD3|nr:hypothetical protein [Micromonospora sp. RTP1Z1]
MRFLDGLLLAAQFPRVPHHLEPEGKPNGGRLTDGRKWRQSEFGGPRTGHRPYGHPKQIDGATRGFGRPDAE